MREANNNKNSNSNPAVAAKSPPLHLSRQASATSTTTPVTSANKAAQGHLDFASLLDVAAAEKERLHKFVATK